MTLRRCRTTFVPICHPTADNPAHGRIEGQSLDIVNVFMPGQPPNDRLTENLDYDRPAVPATTTVLKRISSRHCQVGRFIEFSIGEQPTDRCDFRSIELKLQVAVKFHSHNPDFGFTLRACHKNPAPSAVTFWY